MLDSKFNLYDSPNVILHKSVKIIYFSWLEGKKKVMAFSWTREPGYISGLFIWYWAIYKSMYTLTFLFVKWSYYLLPYTLHGNIW